MGMVCCYFQADDIMVHKIKQGENMNLMLDPENKDSQCCIDKAWHAIHYTLTGEAWEVSQDNILSQLVLGGVPVNDEDMGYGPMRLLDKSIVSQIAEALEEWDETAFREKFNSQAMEENEVYSVMEEENEEPFFQYVWASMDALKAFFKDAARKNQNMLTLIY